MKRRSDQKVVCIIQARMSSSRLPGKVLRELCGHPMLWWVTRRAEKATSVDQVLVATTTNPHDDAVARFCQGAGIALFRGDEFDVLDRYYQAAINHQAGVVVRLTADCPLIDPGLIDRTVSALIAQDLDFAANRLPPPFKRTFPIGLDVEAATFQALELAWREAEKRYEREHVMPYLYAPGKPFRTLVIDHDRDLSHYRWTVDTQQDFDFIQAVMDVLHCHEDFSWLDVLKVLEDHPQLLAINAGVQHKSVSDVDQRADNKSGSEY